MPRPRNDSPARFRMTDPKLAVASTAAGPMMLGSTCRKSTRHLPAPAAMALSTYSAWRSLRSSARYVRAYHGQLVTISANSKFVNDAPRMAAKASAVTSPGSAIIASMIRPTMASILRSPLTASAATKNTSAAAPVHPNLRQGLGRRAGSSRATVASSCLARVCAAAGLRRAMDMGFSEAPHTWVDRGDADVDQQVHQGKDQ